ncbi:hypothetical protein LPUS_07971 [Lasallia pustulata]|uniref:Tat pathway signal sequence n=1 Tax=Lasallia pustulata TaxID=136370 RepID=A0A1W5D4N6_9LECA|nr:hypothetical protein LPUS_07971 [Lasallia pustulata]
MPPPSTQASQRNHSVAEDYRLSIIAEDGDAPPARMAPPKARHRPFSRLWHLGDPPRHSYEKSPPAYSVWNVTRPRGEKLADVRNHKFIARRGGWKRLLILAVITAAVLVALIVGLVVGLRKKHNSSQTSAPSSSSNSSPSGPFPIGSYSLNTFLDTISTNCTSNSATWRCYPYITYSSSPTAALATFSWVITASATSRGNYTISSTENPFAINFVNASLRLLDANAATERYHFRVPINKTVVPSAAITSDNQMANCFFNGTIFEANLYTKLPKTYPPASSSGTSAAASPSSTPGGAFGSWPYAVEVTQTIGGGNGVPDCFEVVNGNPGAQITAGLAAQAAGEMCSCAYKNYDP